MKNMKNVPGPLRKPVVFILFTSWLALMNVACLAAEERSTAPQAPPTAALSAEDSGLLPAEQADRFASTIHSQAAAAGVLILNTSKVNMATNGLFAERRQNLTLQATEPQFLDFLRNVAASNSTLRVRALALRPNPTRSALVISLTVTSHYRLKGAGEAQAAEAPAVEAQVMSERRALRYAALDCYNSTKETLPEGWTLEALNFEGCKRLSIRGLGPADQAKSVEDFRMKLQKAKGQDGRGLCGPTPGGASTRLTGPQNTQVAWIIDLDLKPADSP